MFRFGNFGNFGNFGLPRSTLICLGLHEPSLITIERLKCLKAISGWMDGMGWKSLKALILRAPLCSANNKELLTLQQMKITRPGAVV